MSIGMAADLLDAVEIETASGPDASVIWMHGLGDDGKGWSEVVPALNLPKSLAVRFIFPHAPVVAVTINNGMRMRAWYDIRQANLNERADVDGVRRSQAHVEALVTRETTRGVASRRVLLAGFSQGGAIALYAGVQSRRAPRRIDRIVDVPDRRGSRGGGGECGESRRSGVHGTRHVRSRRCSWRGPSVRATRCARAAGPSNGTCTRSSIPP